MALVTFSQGATPGTFSSSLIRDLLLSPSPLLSHLLSSSSLLLFSLFDYAQCSVCIYA